MEKYAELIEYMIDILDKLIMQKDYELANGFTMAICCVEKFARGEF